MLADDLRILKDFFGSFPTVGNQINIMVIGNTADLKQEIILLKEAIKEFVAEKGTLKLPPPPPPRITPTETFYPEGTGPEQTPPTKKVAFYSDEERKARSVRMKKMHEERKMREQAGNGSRFEINSGSREAR